MHMEKFHIKGRKVCEICDRSCNNLEIHMDKFHNKSNIKEENDELDQTAEFLKQQICGLCNKFCSKFVTNCGKSPTVAVVLKAFQKRWNMQILCCQ